MRVLFIACVFALLAVSAMCLPALTMKSTGYVSEWSKKGASCEEKMIKISFGIKQQNIDVLESLLTAVSNPKSPMYGKYLTIEELSAITSTPASTKAVAEYLKINGAKNIDITQSGDFIRASLPVKSVNSMFKTQVMDFTDSAAKRTISRVPHYTMPAELAEHLDFINHFNHFPSTTSRSFVSQSQKLKPANSQGYTDPTTLFQAYGITGNQVATQKSTQGVFEDNLQSVNSSDISLFQSTFGLPQQQLAYIIGPNDPTQCVANPGNCMESLLDVEWMMAVAQHAPTTFYGIDQTDPTPFIDWLIDLSNDANAPLVNSVSYGENELAIGSSTPKRFNTEIMKMGARGITVMVSSGDDGANGSGARNNVPAGCGFSPSYPATSPYVTSVGATQGPETSTPEIGCSSSTNGLITSGGGFSTVWSAPSYQQSVVNAYLSQSNTTGEMPPTDQYVATGRGYPDVALLGHNYLIIDGGQEYIVSGTSCSSPVFGALITLVNGKRMAAGKAALGFLNPALYQIAASNPSVFNDVTSGWNNCPASQSVPPECCPYGFPATAGWDAMTGLGSVNFPKLMAALLAL